MKRLQVIEEDGCQQLSKVVGGYLLERLSSLRDEFECVGDVRGKGLMVGFELVHDKACTQCLFQTSFWGRENPPLKKTYNPPKKVKFSHTRYRALGPELIPVYRQSARR